MRRTAILKDGLISLSLANLCFSSVWGELLAGSRAYYFMDHPPSRTAFIAILLNVLLLAVVFFLFGRFIRRFLSKRQRDLTRLVFFGVVFVALNSLRRSAWASPAQEISQLLGPGGFRALQVMVAAVVVFGVVRRRNWLMRTVKVLVLMLSPLIVLTFSQALWSLINYEAVTRKFAAPLASPLTVHSNAPRVVWLLFDELDQQIAFAERPAGLQLSEFDRFRKQAIYSTHAYPVAGETELALPALIMGRAVSKAKPVNASTLLVTLGDTHETVDWASQPNIFAKARGAGFNTAVVGFFHPYDRVLGRSLTECFWWGAWGPPHVWRYSPLFTLSETMICQTRGILEAIPEETLFGLSARFLDYFENIRAKVLESRLQRHVRVVEQAKEVAANRDLGLVFIHLPVPHLPFIYDRFKGQLVADGKQSYLDNLALADCTLGELRKVMEDAGVWQNSAVLVTSDHWYREKPMKPWLSQGESFTLSNYRDHRVPLLLKLPGQQRGATYEDPFNSVIIHDLILALLVKGSEMSQPEAVLRWLDNHGKIIPLTVR